MTTKDELERRAKEYAQQRGLTLADELGFGVHGSVFGTTRQPEKDPSAIHSAIKAHEHETDYGRERDVYLRLKELEISDVLGCHVPRLLDFDDNLWVIEMTVVSRPFVLDFGGAFLDQAPEFSEEVLADWYAEKKEQFGPRWGDAQSILAILASYGIFVVDVHPRNISFLD